jgi:anti-sigma factor RsiW
MTHDINELISGYLDGVLTDEQQAQLGKWIEAAPANADQFAEAVLLDNRIHAELNAAPYKSHNDLAEASKARYEPVPVVDERVEELVEPRATRLEPLAGRNFWLNSAATLAVVVLVWMNLSISATSATDCRVQMASTSDEVNRLAAEIHELLPELSPAEARRHAILASAGGGLAFMPNLPPSSMTRGQQNLMYQLLK